MIFSAEWTYLLTTRKVGGEDSVFSFARIKYGSNPTDTVTGVIIYPDDFSFSEAGVASMPFGARRNQQTTQINAADWAALEEAGCVFLPTMPTVGFNGDNLKFDENATGIYVNYYSATALTASQAVRVYWATNSPYLSSSQEIARYYKLMVRLAQDL